MLSGGSCIGSSDIRVKELEEFFRSCDGCEPLLDLVTISDLDNKPGVYAIYLRDQGGCKLLYIGETSSLFRRLVDLIGFRHTFSWRLFIRILEEKLGRSVKDREAIKLWYEDKDLRKEVVKEVGDFLRRTCIKWRVLEGSNRDERRSIEKELINRLKPLEPHEKGRFRLLKGLLKDKS